MTVTQLKQQIDTSGPCWIWTGTPTKDGYSARVWIDGVFYQGVHIFLYTLKYGPPAGVLHHTCENRLCVNPGHLEDKSRADHAREHHKRTHCINGHELSGYNLYINPKGDRHCKLCNRLRQRARRSQ